VGGGKLEKRNPGKWNISREIALRLSEEVAVPKLGEATRKAHQEGEWVLNAIKQKGVAGASAKGGTTCAGARGGCHVE